MSEESPENYNSGDIVWVKLGSSWWPGEVKDTDELPNEVVDFKKPPLVIVKFFDEDSYEYVKTWSNIYPYNSEKKNEFIKKGMAAFRSKVPHMEKFPKDVLTAESRMGGNPNILSEPMFLPEKKRNYTAEVFGNPSPKSKGNKEKKRSSTSKSSSQKDTAHITHRRFLGVDDYRAYICIQYPGKDRIPGDKEDEEVLRINKEPEQEFNCHSCSFTTKRLEVMILHTKSHIQGVYISSPRKTKHPAIRRKKDKLKKPRGSDDLTDSDSSSSDSDYVREKKRKPKSQNPRKPKAKKVEAAKEEPKTSSDIRSELLAVWDDSDEDEEFDLSLNRSSGPGQNLSQSINDIILGKSPSAEPQKESETSFDGKNQTTDTDSSLSRSRDQPGTSRDFMEDSFSTSQSLSMSQDGDVSKSAEVDDNVSKDPETIPKDPEAQGEMVGEPSAENLANATGVSGGLESGNSKASSADTTLEGDESKEEETSKEDPEKVHKESSEEAHKMDKDIQEAIKSCFDFDEDEEDDSPLIGRATAGRKIPRVIPPAERRKSQESTEEDLNPERILKETEAFNRKDEEEARSEDVDATFRELMEMTSVPELPDVQNTLKCEQNFHNIKTIKFPDKPDPVGPSAPDIVAGGLELDVAEGAPKPDAVDTSKLDHFSPNLEAVGSSKLEEIDPEATAFGSLKPDTIVAKTDTISPLKPEKKESSDISLTKLINPKKRFVKSFEDFELMQNEIRRKEEEDAKTETILVKAGASIKQDDLDQEDHIELSKLKSKIMSKIIEEAKINEECKGKIMSNIRCSPKKEEIKEEVKTGSHRTPRSKILELYRNDANKQKVEEDQKLEKVEGNDLSLNNKAENIEEKPKEASIKSEAVPPKKGKWSRRGSHPKKDRNVFLMEDSKVEDVVPRIPETVEKNEDIATDNNQTLTDSSNILVSANSNDVAEEKSVSIKDNDENLVKDKIDEEQSDKFLLLEENDKIISPIIEGDMKEEDSGKSLTEKFEDQESSVREDLMPIQDVVNEKIMTEEPSAEPCAIEKSIPTQEILVENLPSNDVECKDLPKEESSLVPEEEKQVGVGEEIDKIEESNGLLEDPQVDSNAKSMDIDDNTEVLPKEPILLEKSITTSEELVPETTKVVPEEIVEEIEAEEPRPSSPTIDVVTPSPVPVKDVICSPPKKSKKRKISENLLASEADVRKPDVDVEDFCPAEKKKKDTESDDKEVKEPTVEKESGPSADTLREHKSEINDMAVVKDGAVTPKTAQEVVADHNNELEIQCGSSSPESFKFSIQTNLSNLTSREEISALALATLSEIKADLEASDNSLSEDKLEKTMVLPAPVESELVPIEGNLTVVSERDLADGQVEITTEQVINPKRPVTLSTFSMDFSDSASDSNSTNDSITELSKCTLPEFNARGTEFTPKAMTKQIKKVDRKKENAYERLELLNILEGNSDVEKKPKDALLMHHKPQVMKAMVDDDICDFEEHIPSQIVCAKKLNHDSSLDREYPYTEKIKSGEKSTTSKLLERLTGSASKAEKKEVVGKIVGKAQIQTTKVPKFAAKTKSLAKPLILSEQIVKPATVTAKTKSKKAMNDIEDVEAFVIHKDPKRAQENEDIDVSQLTKTAGKAKILQQTIITPAGEIIQPNTVTQTQTDDNIFDINSMPIVLSDEILTPESIENMPIMIGSETKTADPDTTTPKRPTQGRIVPKTVTVTQTVAGKTPIVAKQNKLPRIIQTVGNKAIKTSPMLPNTAKPGKYIILPQSGVQAAKYVAKKGPLVKRTSIVPKSAAVTPEPSGNKIMIVTNQQGQQQRLLLTPAQQKMLGYQNQKTKTLVKGNVVQKSVLATKTSTLVEASTSGLVSKSPSLVGQKIVVGTSPSTGLLATSSTQVVGTHGRIIKSVTKKVHPMSQKPFSGANKTQKTILIKNQHGQTVRKIQGTDDELLDKQVAEQLEAIKASSGMKFSSQPKPAESYKAKTPVRRSYSKKTEPKAKPAPPPLSSIQPSPKADLPMTIASLQPPKKPETIESKPKPTPTFVTDEVKPSPDRPLNQLVIQDAVGNQTTITEGQILALPSETVDGQPQSYMLVTLDESGNLTPLNSEALMSLDPNLGLGGDLSNMVLQIDQGAFTDRPQSLAVKATVGSEPPKPVPVEMEPPAPVPVPEASITTEIAETAVDQKVVAMSEPVQPVVPSTNGDPGQQLIVTGDPIATQKFLESLTEGTTDLANILANAEGNSILIQADGQQILINTNSDNQMLLSVNNDNLNASESTEGGGNPIFASQPSKNQDILAAALADTDVFQQEQHAAQSKITSQLSPNNTLYPMNVGNVLETSLTLSSPIMTPLEVPSTNNKKIPDDEADILTQVPKNVDLPITITDPNISQTVANQQVASLMTNELQTNLELALPVSETAISSVSTDMNSPSYVYSLPTLDESVDINQKPFNSSMPLLNEDIEEATEKPKDDDKVIENAKEESSSSGNAKPTELTAENSFLEEEGRFTLGGEMCSSLSEPPPEMFDLPEDNQNLLDKRNSNIPSSLQSTPDISDNASKDGDMTDLSTQAESSNEDSCEIPLQPQIVTKSLDLPENLSSIKRNLESDEEASKRCKFD